MTARHWMEIAALASALGFTGTALAQDTHGTTTTDDRGSVSSYRMETPSSGAIVTPEDKAAGMGRHDEDARNRNGDANHDTPNDNASNNDEMYVAPAQSNDQDLTANPSYPDTNKSSPRYGAPGSMMDEDSASVPPRTGADVRPGDMGPGNVRGE